MTSDARGGAEYAAVDLLDALAARGHSTMLLTNQPALVHGRRVQAREVDLGPKLSRRSYRGLISHWPSLSLRLRTELRREWPYDVLLTFFKKEQLLAAGMPKALRPLLAWAEWGPVPFEISSGPGRLAYRAAASRTDLIMAVSPGTRDSIRATGVPARKLHVVPNALQVQEHHFSAAGRQRVRRELQIGEEALVVGLVSRLHPKKRNDVAVDAVVWLRRDDVHLVIAGEGPEQATLRAHAAELGERAHFIPTPGAEMTDVLSAFDVAVFCPSPTEGAPLAVIHAMLAGRPLVATGAEGVADLLPTGAGMIASPENDVAAVAAAICAYLDDAPGRARAGEIARESAQRTFAAADVGELVERLLTRSHR